MASLQLVCLSSHLDLQNDKSDEERERQQTEKYDAGSEEQEDGDDKRQREKSLENLYNTLEINHEGKPRRI